MTPLEVPLDLPAIGPYGLYVLMYLRSVCDPTTGRVSVSTRNLCAHLQMSRTTLSKALARLEDTGYVTYYRGGNQADQTTFILAGIAGIAGTEYGPAEAGGTEYVPAVPPDDFSFLADEPQVAAVAGTPNVPAVPPEPQQEPKKKREESLKVLDLEELTDKERKVYEAWAAAKIVGARGCTVAMRGTIRTILRHYTVDEVCMAISAYGTIVNGRDYWYSHRYILRDFLTRGLDKFLPEAKPFESFRKTDAAREPTEEVRSKYAGLSHRAGSKRDGGPDHGRGRVLRGEEPVERQGVPSGDSPSD